MKKVFTMLLLIAILLPTEVWGQINFSYIDPDTGIDWHCGDDPSMNGQIYGENTYGASNFSGVLEFPKEVFGPGAWGGYFYYTIRNVQGFDNYTKMKGVKFHSQITYITGFENCTNLEHITFGENTTPLLGVHSAFVNCNNLRYFDMKAIRSNFTIESGKKWARNEVDCPYKNIPIHTLVYLHDTQDVTGGKVDIDEENIIYKGTCKNFKVYNGHSSYIPYPFTTETAQYNRTFIYTGNNSVSTLYLPYPTDLPDGMQAYEFVRKKVINGGKDKVFYFKPVPLGTRLEANHPYLICITDGQNHTLPVMQNVEVPATPILSSTATTSDDGDWSFNGTTETIANAEAAAMNAYYLSGNRWWAIQNGVANDYIGAFRCFMSSPTGAVPAKSFFMVLDDEDATTKIKELEENTEADLKSGKHVFYSIDGKRIGTDYDSLDSGQIYIVNGKKFYKL